MNIWHVLGIKETKDKDEIKEAYINKLVTVNPEDDAKGFMELRAAYDEAVRLADTDEGETEEFPDTPIGRWMRRVDEVYNNFYRRIDESVWDELLDEDICFELDTRAEAEEELLKYLSVHHMLPHAIWKKLDEYFEISANKDELSEKLSPDFIRYVVNNAQYEDSISFYLFEQDDPSLDYDGYILTYLEMVVSLQNKDVDKVRSLMEELESSGITHPSERIQRVHLYIYEKKYDEAFALAQDIVGEYPDMVEARVMMAEIYYGLNDTDNARKWYEKTLELAPEHASARCGVADCDMKLGNYVEAKAVYRDLLNRNRFATYVHKCMMDCNEKLIPFYEEKLKADEADDESRVELSWCLYQNYRFEESLKVLEDQERDNIYQLDFLYLKARNLLQLNRAGEADELFGKWTRLFPSYKEETGECAKRNREREGLVYFFMAETRFADKKYDEALSFNDRALECAILDKGMILNQRGVIYYSVKRYDDAMKCLGETLELEPMNFEAYTCMGDCCMEMGQLRDALENYNAAIESYPYYPKPYLQQVKIFMDLDILDEALEILDRMDSLEIESDQAMLYRAKILYKKDDHKGHMELIAKLEDRLAEDKGYVSDLEDVSEVFFEKASILYNLGVDKDNKRACEALDRAISINPDKPRYYYMYSWILWEQKKYEEALKYCDKTLEVGGESTTVYFQMAGIYHEMEDDREEEVLKKIIELAPEDPEVYGHLGQYYESKDKRDEAIDAYTKQLDINPSGYYYVARGILYFQAGENEASIADCQAALEFGDNEAYANYNSGRVHMALGHLEEAKLLFEKAIEVADKPTEIFYRYLARTYCRMGEWREAVKTLRLQIKLKIKPTLGYYYLGQIYKSRGMKKEALNAFKMGYKRKDSFIRDFVKEITELLVEVQDKDQTYQDGIREAAEFIESIKKGRHLSSEAQEALAYIYSCADMYEKEYKIRKKLSKYDAGSWYDFALAAVQASREEKVSEKKRAKYLQDAADAFSQAAGFAREECKSYESMAYGLKMLAGIAIDLKMLDTAKELLDELKDTQLCDHCMHKGCFEYYYQLARYEKKSGNIKEARAAIKKALAIAPNDLECRLLAKELEE